MENKNNYKILNEISSKKLKLLSFEELRVLSFEIRHFLINSVSKTGGHLASNLGVVELTLALHKVFDFDYDKVIWDVGHQCYIHKILTDRKEKFSTLRQFNGISGFPKAEESYYDFFNTGHSGTSISAALGFAKGMEILGNSSKSIAVVGDAAITEGIAFEALNHLGETKSNVIIVLNDNGMSISENVGAVSNCLNKIRNNQLYFKIKKDVKNTLGKIPFGKEITSALREVKNCAKQIVISKKIFEDFGIIYKGPVYGHNIESLIASFGNIKEIEGPVLLHVHTKKGKGYRFAEQKPHLFHSIGEFNPKTGEVIEKIDTEQQNELKVIDFGFSFSSKTYSRVFGEGLCKIARENKNVVAVTAAMPDGTGLSLFRNEFSNRFFNVGIAEQHAVTFCAGLSKMGIIPFFAVYSSFLQRAYDQILHDVALQNLHVVFMIDRAGIVGEDGETHQGIYDISFLLGIPYIEILAPSSMEELLIMMKYSISVDKPIFIRYPKGLALHDQRKKQINSDFTEIMAKKRFVNSENVAIICVGTTINDGFMIFEDLISREIGCSLIHAGRLKPISIEFYNEICECHDLLVVIEDGIEIGGFGSYLESKTKRSIMKFAYPDEKICQGSIKDIKKKFGMSAKKIFERILVELNQLSS